MCNKRDHVELKLAYGSSRSLYIQKKS